MVYGCWIPRSSSSAGVKYDWPIEAVQPCYRFRSNITALRALVSQLLRRRWRQRMRTASFTYIKETEG